MPLGHGIDLGVDAGGAGDIKTLGWFVTTRDPRPDELFQRLHGLDTQFVTLDPIDPARAQEPRAAEHTGLEPGAVRQDGGRERGPPEQGRVGILRQALSD